MLAVRNCCYVAGCSAARGTSAPTGRGRRGWGHIVAAARQATACFKHYGLRSRTRDHEKHQKATYRAKLDSLIAGMWVSRPGLGLETDQDHFFEVLVLVLASLVLVSVSEGGLEQDPRLCATATLLVSKVETSK